MNKVTLQINIAPGDYRHCIHLLEHQFSIFNDQVTEILLTYDSRPRKIQNLDVYEENKKKFSELFKKLEKKYSFKVQEIDYSTGRINEVYTKYFNRPMPTHDYRGAPVYGYLFGIEEAMNDLVIHIDSDMFFGGLSHTWVSEAVELLKSDPKILTVSPLPGPPHPDNTLVDQPDYFRYGENGAFGFNSMSTRIFMIDKTRLYGGLKFHKPAWQNRIFSAMEGFSSLEALEILISNFMRKENLIRVDFKGKEPGLWSVHPTYRSEEFYQRIPEMIDRLARNDVPEDQLGYYNFSMSFIDWTEALENFEKNRLRNKMLRKFKLIK